MEILNRKARFDYEIFDTYEAGIAMNKEIYLIMMKLEQENYFYIKKKYIKCVMP